MTTIIGYWSNARNDKLCRNFHVYNNSRFMFKTPEKTQFDQFNCIDYN